MVVSEKSITFALVNKKQITYNINQLKDMLGIGITLAYRLVKQNTINSLKIGREYKIPKANIISYLVDENRP